MPSLRLSCVPGRLWMTTTRKTPTMRTPTPMDRLAPSPARAQVSTVAAILFISSHFTHRLFCIITDRTPHLPIPSPNYPSIPRCSDFLLLPQTAPRPILSQERHASLRLMAARPRPPTVPWAPAAAACSMVGPRQIMTHIHPRPIHLLYPATA